MVRLGQNVFLKGRLDRSAVHRTLQAFNSFKSMADNLRVNKLIAFGTSALREASDSSDFLDQVRRQTGIQVRVIPGIEEARLIARGILSNEKLGVKMAALVDIGGGSTEISICKNKKVLHSKSFALGSARLQQLFLRETPPDPKAVKELRRYIRAVLEKRIDAEEWPQVDLVVGSSGTIKAISRILKKNGDGASLNRESVRRLVKQLCKMSPKEILKLPGLESKRADMFLSGAVLFEESMDAVGAKRFSFTEYSLRDGILDRELHHHQPISAANTEIRVEDLFQRARVLLHDESRLRRVDALATRLFSRLSELHRLSDDWCIYLRAAAIFRDSGKSVSLLHYPVHSYYIVKNADIPSAEEWELELVGQLCRHHQHDGKPGRGDLNEIHEKQARQAFQKLLAMLRIIDALDSGPDAIVHLERVSIDKKGAEIRFSGKNLTGLEAIRVERQKALFEEIFDCPVVAVKS